jgi:hypothetical protein
VLLVIAATKVGDSTGLHITEYLGLHHGVAAAGKEGGDLAGKRITEYLTNVYVRLLYQ